MASRTTRSLVISVGRSRGSLVLTYRLPTWSLLSKSSTDTRLSLEGSLCLRSMLCLCLGTSQPGPSSPPWPGLLGRRGGSTIAQSSVTLSLEEVLPILGRPWESSSNSSRAFFIRRGRSHSNAIASSLRSGDRGLPGYVETAFSCSRQSSDS